MVELFENISNLTKIKLEKIVDIALSVENKFKGMKLLSDYVGTLNDEEQEFADFYINLRLSQLKETEDVT